MKFFNQINDITMKVAKGMVAVFTIKLILFLAILTFNACSSEDSEITENNNLEFQNAFDSSLNKLNSIGLISTNGAMARLNGSSKTLHLVNDDLEQNFDDTNFLNSINDLNSLVNVQQQNNLSLLESFDNNSNVLGTYIIDEQSVLDGLQPAIQEARNYLIDTKGFTNKEIDNMIIQENGQEEDLVLFVKHLVSIENQESISVSTNEPLNLFVNYSYAQAVQHNDNTLTASEVVTCAAVAIGADLLWSLGGSNASSWSKGAMKRAFGKVAARFLGPIGVAIAVVSFGLCILNEAQD